MNDCAMAVAKRSEYIYMKEFEDEYPNAQRKGGSGEIRINRPLIVREDLYSFLFITSLHAEYIYSFKEQKEKDDEVKEKALEHFKETEIVYKKEVDVASLLAKRFSLMLLQPTEINEERDKDDDLKKLAQEEVEEENDDGAEHSEDAKDQIEESDGEQNLPEAKEDPE